MRYELTDHEWFAIKPFLPNKPRGVPRVDDRRVLNGIFWVLRSGAPWRDLPRSLGPYTTPYNRFVRWRRAVVWSRIMSALATTHDASVQMIDTSIVRAHQHAACIARNRSRSMGRSRGGQSSKIHAVVDANGLPVQVTLTAGEAHDNRLSGKMLSRLKSGTMLLADRGYDADWIRALAGNKGVWANIPPKCNRNSPICFSPYLYRARNLIERFFNRICPAAAAMRSAEQGAMWRVRGVPSIPRRFYERPSAASRAKPFPLVFLSSSMFADARAREETRNRWATRETMDLTIGLSVEIDPVSHSHPGVQQVANRAPAVPDRSR
jgi:transposase